MAGKTRRVKKPEIVQVNIQTGTILKIVFIVLAIGILYFLRGIGEIILLSLLLAAFIDPLASRLEKKHIPRGFAVAGIYILLITGVVLLAVLILPTLINQTGDLLLKYSSQIEQLTNNTFSVEAILSQNFFQQDFTNLVQAVQNTGVVDAFPQLMSLVIDTFGGLITLTLIFILAFYMVIEEESLKSRVNWLTPKHYKKFVLSVAPEIRRKIGLWLQGQLILMFIIFLMTYISLLIIGAPFALSLALIAGILEAVPFVGPTIAAVPAVIVVFAISPAKALIVLVIYFVIQQLEAEFITPRVMQKAVGLNPVITILVIMIGYSLSGVVGAILAIPITMIVIVFAEEWSKYKKIS